MEMSDNYIYKNFDGGFKIFDLLNNLNETEISFVDYPSLTGCLSKEGKEITLSLHSHELGRNDHKNVIIKLQNQLLKLSIGFKSMGTSLDIKKGVGLCSSYYVYAINSYQFDEKQKGKHQMFIYTPVKKLTTFHPEISTITYQDDHSIYGMQCIRLTIYGKIFDVIQRKYSIYGFYIIECLSELSIEIFKDYSFAIQQTIGYLLGYMPGGEEFILTENQEWSYSNIHRPALDSMYKSVSNNPYSYSGVIPKVVSDKYYPLLRPLPSEVVSKLAYKIFESQSLSSIILMMLECFSIRSFLTIPSILSISLEALSKFISSPNIKDFIPISDKNLAESIINELKYVIDKHAGEIQEDGQIKLKRRINELNRPVNYDRQTNNQKLIRPFDILGIKLSDDDIKAIEHRNDFLHGNILLETNEIKSLDEIDNYIAYISDKLYTLINKLILKNCGYSGYVYNYAKRYGASIKKEENEEYFQLI